MSGWYVTFFEGDNGERGSHVIAEDHPAPSAALDVLIGGSRTPRVVKTATPARRWPRSSPRPRAAFREAA